MKKRFLITQTLRTIPSEDSYFTPERLAFLGSHVKFSADTLHNLLTLASLSEIEFIFHRLERHGFDATQLCSGHAALRTLLREDNISNLQLKELGIRADPFISLDEQEALKSRHPGIGFPKTHEYVTTTDQQPVTLVTTTTLPSRTDQVAITIPEQDDSIRKVKLLIENKEIEVDRRALMEHSGLFRDLFEGDEAVDSEVLTMDFQYTQFLVNFLTCLDGSYSVMGGKNWT